MENNKEQSDVVDVKLGQLALDSAGKEVEASNANPKPEAAAATKENEPISSDDYQSEIPSKSLMECYPEVADDKNERLYADVRRHWLGRFMILGTGGGLTLIIMLFALSTPSLLKSLDYTVSSGANAIIALVFLFVAVLLAIGTFITLWVYNQSRMLITDQNVIEVRQISLFSHKVSHLNIINVEDVTVIKKGILQTLFDYGTMIIETAGEQENFSFPNTPTPDKYRRIVINNHEDAIERIGRMGSAQRIQITNNGF